MAKTKMGMCAGKERKASFLLHIDRKSSGRVMLFYSLPFAVPTHSGVTAKNQNKYAFLGVLMSVGV